VPAGSAAAWDCGGWLDGSRLLTPPWGLNGGHPGGRGAFRFGDRVEPFVNGSGRLRAGETVDIITPGAGGYGKPSAPDPAAVERDLADDAGCIRRSYQREAEPPPRSAGKAQKRDHGRAGRKLASHPSHQRVSMAGGGASALRRLAGRLSIVIGHRR
jgi:hypothetical protein